ncbi:MAG: glycosyltransferase [Chloroflexi bacterium]|nr:glycosyltransferase [Chloroflexota bacterium]
MSVSVIATVLNEGSAIRRLLDSLAAQTRPPDEVVIVDGGSTDETVMILNEYVTERRLPLRVLIRPGYNISQGRNAAIAAATGQIIASTDAGVRLSPNWLDDLVAAIEGGADVASGFFQPDPQNLFEIAMGATVLPALADVRPEKFLPSSRSVAFRRSAWGSVGGYPEWLDYCEDLIFDFRLRDAGYRFTFVPTAIAYFRPRSTLGAFVRQYYRYARGDGKADLWRWKHAIRYITYLIALPALLILSAGNPRWLLTLILGGLGVFYTPYKRLWPMLRGRSVAEKIAALALVPIIRVSGDIAKMVGYPVGLWWRRQHRRTATRSLL